MVGFDTRCRSDAKLLLFGKMLLDLEDPSIILAKLQEPLITPNEIRREGYVPENVLYTCRAIVHENQLVIPYAMSDYATTFATVGVEPVYSAAMT